MPVIEHQVLEILERQLSNLIARSVLRRCTAAMGIHLSEFELRHVPEFVRQLEVGIRLFVAPEHQRALLDDVRKLTADTPRAEPPRNTAISIAFETDVTAARREARALATDLGAGSFAAQKITTAVSELARNIVLYAGSGRIELIPRKLAPPRLRVIASDRGPGIARLDHVLSGQYKSRTGLGRGLLAVRRIAESFDVETGPRGTTVTAEFEL
jgi:serine/threonine-protein kinase RsbT